MGQSVEAFRAFLSSPGDVKRERAATKDVVDAVNRNCKDSLGLSVDLWRWEDQPPIAPRLPDERLQEIINREVEKAHFFILVLNKRYGSIEPGSDKSNTEREIEAILTRYEAHPQLKILAYFRRIDENADPGEQEVKVRELRDRLGRLGIIYREYDDATQYRDMLTNDLYNVAMRMRLSPFKTNALQQFWQFGTSERPTHPRIAILYPPVPRAAMASPQTADLWTQRLAPHVYFEDHKALRKVEKILSLMGIRDSKTYSVDDPPNDLEFMNRIWVCMPRNRAAMVRFRCYEDSLFALGKEVGGRPTVLTWLPQSDNPIRVRSPLAKYLQLQRGDRKADGVWQRSYCDIVARDYAVLARYSDYSQDGTDDGPLRDYFLAGLRGLGTWGAAWYADRKYKALMDYEPTDDMAVLLEVTYKNGRIHLVEDVSDRPQEYFDRANHMSSVKAEIRKYQEQTGTK